LNGYRTCFVFLERAGVGGRGRRALEHQWKPLPLSPSPGETSLNQIEAGAGSHLAGSGGVGRTPTLHIEGVLDSVGSRIWGDRVLHPKKGARSAGSGGPVAGASVGWKTGAVLDTLSGLILAGRVVHEKIVRPQGAFSVRSSGVICGVAIGEKNGAGGEER
jgi:hypothetical protein